MAGLFENVTVISEERANYVIFMTHNNENTVFWNAKNTALPEMALSWIVTPG